MASQAARSPATSVVSVTTKCGAMMETEEPQAIICSKRMWSARHFHNFISRSSYRIYNAGEDGLHGETCGVQLNLCKHRSVYEVTQ